MKKTLDYTSLCSLWSVVLPAFPGEGPWAVMLLLSGSSSLQVALGVHGSNLALRPQRQRSPWQSLCLEIKVTDFGYFRYFVSHFWRLWRKWVPVLSAFNNNPQDATPLRVLGQSPPIGRAVIKRVRSSRYLLLQGIILAHLGWVLTSRLCIYSVV